MSPKNLHRICWGCYQSIFSGTSAASCVDPEHPSGFLPAPKKCHFCGEETDATMQMYRGRDGGYDCAPIHIEEQLQAEAAEMVEEEMVEEEMVVVPPDLSPMEPAEGDLYTDRDDLTRWWLREGGKWVQVPTYHQLKQQLAEAQQIIESLKETAA